MALPVPDTEYGSKWSDFRRLIADYGFKVVLLDKFTHKSTYERPHEEELLVAFSADKGLLLVATSYHGGLNSGKVYAEVEIPADMSWEERRAALGEFSGGCITKDGVSPKRFHVDYDVRYSIIGTLRNIDNSRVSFCKTWTKLVHPRHLWLVDYQQEGESQGCADKHRDGGFFDRCRDERTARLPAEVREACALT